VCLKLDATVPWNGQIGFAECNAKMELECLTTQKTASIKMMDTGFTKK
jgi:hypothetical protein